MFLVIIRNLKGVNMKKKEMIEVFSLTSGTLSNWDTGKQGEQRKLLYEVLKSLPIEYVKERAKMINIDIHNFNIKEDKQK